MPILNKILKPITGKILSSIIKGGDIIPIIISFVSDWKTNNTGVSASNQITIPTTSSGIYNCLVEWGDGNDDTITTFNDPAWTHTYSIAGTYPVKITGIFRGFRFNDTGDKLKLLNISEWGILQFAADNAQFFYGCKNLTITATDIPDLSGITNMESALRDCDEIVDIPNLSQWDFVGKTNLGFMLANNLKFNGSFDGIDISTVQTLQSFVADNPEFNQSFNSLNFASAINVSNFARNCPKFNQPVDNLDFPNALSLLNFFQNDIVFNQPVPWNMANKTTIQGILDGCFAFNQPSVSAWITSNIFIFNQAFRNTALKQDLSAWSFANAIQAIGFLDGVDLGTYNYTKLLKSIALQVINPNVPFSGGNSQYYIDAVASRAIITGAPNTWAITDGGLLPSFSSVWKTDNAGASNNNQILLPLVPSGTYNAPADWGDGNEDTITVWNDPTKTHTYAVAGTYNVNITGTIQGLQFEDFSNPHDPLKLLEVLSWGSLKLGNTGNYFRGCSNLTLVNVADVLDLSGTTSLFGMFIQCSSLTTINNINSWIMSAITSTSFMFATSNFNDDIDLWNTPVLNNTSGMFSSNPSFNKPILFYFGAVSNAQLMFSFATSFDQDLGSLDVTNLQFALNMFNGVTLSTANYDSLLIGWAAQVVKPNVSFNGGNSKYSPAAAAARATLAGAPNNWAIIDGGPV